MWIAEHACVRRYGVWEGSIAEDAGGRNVGPPASTFPLPTVR
jgi:hypothetical protein